MPRIVSGSAKQRRAAWTARLRRDQTRPSRIVHPVKTTQLCSALQSTDASNHTRWVELRPCRKGMILAPLLKHGERVVEETTNSRTLYKRAFAPEGLNPEEMRGEFQWFSFKKGYGTDDTYGAYQAQYKCKRMLRLIDIGKLSTRQQLVELYRKHCSEGNRDITDDLNGEIQYSGSHFNTRAHQAIQKVAPYYGHGKWDGTMIHTGDFDENDETQFQDFDQSLENICEVVLWAQTISTILDCQKRF